MKRWIVAGIAVSHALRLGVVEAAVDMTKAALETARAWAKGAWKWHQCRMMTDPTYPVALLGITRALVRISVPQAALAATLVALAAELLGGVGLRSWSDDEGPDWI